MFSRRVLSDIMLSNAGAVRSTVTSLHAEQPGMLGMRLVPEFSGEISPDVRYSPR